MSFSEKKDSKSGVNIIKCPARIDINVSDDLRDRIVRIIQKNEFKIVLDLSDTKYVDSSGLGAIVSRISLLRSNKGDVKLAVVPKTVSNLLELTHLNKILKDYSSIDEAIKSF